MMIATVLALLLGVSGSANGAAPPLPFPGPSALATDTVPSLSPAVPVASIGYMTAGDLADRCSGSSLAGTAYCFAYIAAVHDTMRAYEAWLNQREFCVPPRTSQSDLRRAFLTYLSAYPSGRKGQASSVVVVALKETYLCATPSATDGAPAMGPVGKVGTSGSKSKSR